MKLLETAVRLVNQPTVGQCSGFFLSMLQIMLLLNPKPTQQSHLTVNHLSFFGLSCGKHLPFTKWKSDVCFRRSACLGEIPDLPKITNFKTAYCWGGNHLVRNNSPQMTRCQTWTLMGCLQGAEDTCNSECQQPAIDIKITLSTLSRTSTAQGKQATITFMQKHCARRNSSNNVGTHRGS